MKNVNWKELFIDIIIDIVAGMIMQLVFTTCAECRFPGSWIFRYRDHSVSLIRIAGRCRNHHLECTCCNLLL